MGVAIYSEIGRRIPSSVVAPIVGGPYFGRPYFPRDQASQRVHFVRDIGGIPFEQCMQTGSGGASYTNRIVNPRFEVDASGWVNVTRYPYGGMFGASGCGKIEDQDVTIADLDGYYSYDHGSALPTDGHVFFGCWLRSVSGTSVGLPLEKHSIKLRVQDQSGTIKKTASYRQVRSSDGSVWCSFLIGPTAWGGNILHAGVEFQVSMPGSGGSSKAPLFIEGAILCLLDAAILFPSESAYHDGSFPGSAWSGSADASTSTVAADRHAKYDITRIPYSTREGFLSAMCFPAPSADVQGSDGSGASAIRNQTLFSMGESGKLYLFALVGPRVNGDGWYIPASVGAGGATLDLAGWPRCPLHVVLAWDDARCVLGVRGYFDPADYDLSSNIAIATGSPDHGRANDISTAASLYVGSLFEASGSLEGTGVAFEGQIADFNLGNRGLNEREVVGILKHGRGPYTGTIAWALYDEDTDLRLIEAVSFHPNAPLSLERHGYAPSSGLVTVSGSGRGGAALTRSSTRNVQETLSFMGRGNDVQKMFRAISDLSRLLENVHKLNESSRQASYLVWAPSPLQKGHEVLRHFPAPKMLRARLVSGQITLDPRLTGPYGQKGKVWGQFQIERWGYFEGPRTKLLLAKNNTTTPALTFTAQNFNDASDTTDSHYFEVPEGLVEGDLEAAALAYLRAPASSSAGRVRLARRSRGIPSEVKVVYEAEAAGNRIFSAGADLAVAARSGGTVRTITDLAAGNEENLIAFELLDLDASLPEWLYGEFRAIVMVNAQTGPIDSGAVEFRGFVSIGSGVTPDQTTPGSWVTSIISQAQYTAIDLGIFRIPPFTVPRVLSAVDGDTNLGLSFTVQGRRNSGTADLRVDCLLLLPADECYVQADRNTFNATVASYGIVLSSLDGQESAFVVDPSDRIRDIMHMRSRGPYVQPGRPNRFWLLVDGWDASNEYFNDAASGATIELHYVPRHLLVPSYEGGAGGGWA